jgi:prepilin-type N-terminal cleavage/methylation domain-containing protein
MKSYGNTQLTAHSGPERGYTILEVVFVILVIGVVMANAAPSTQTALQNYHLSQAVKDVSGAIQSTRYLAIMKGYTYNIAFTQNSKSYQVGVKIPPSTTFSNSGSPVVWGVTSDVMLGTSPRCSSHLAELSLQPRDHLLSHYPTQSRRRP